MFTRNPLVLTVRQNDWLEFYLGFGNIAVLSSEHVHLSLIHAELANVCLQEEDVSALHARVEDLSRRQVVLLFPPHNRAATNNLQA